MSIFGADKIWLPAGSGSWFTGTNWGPTFGTPGASDVAIISNGGTANANATSSAVGADRIEVGKSQIGTLNSSGTMTIGGTNRNVTIDLELDIGEIGNTVATGAVNATTNGTVTISNALEVRVGFTSVAGSGSVNVGSTGTGTGATANGTGSFTVNSATLLDSFEDLDVAQASADVNSTATSNGTLAIGNVATVDIGGDFDIGQAGGTGRATAVGNATVSAVPTMHVGLSLVLGRTTGSTGLGNSGRGTASITDANFNVGFANVALPGDMDLGDAIVAGTERATAFGSLILTRVDANVKRRINLGELRGGSSDTLTTTEGTLSLVNTSVTAGSLDVATVLDNTKGTPKGKLLLNASLVDLAGAMTLGAGSELLFMLAGTTRSVGGTSPGQYGAIDASSALFDGKLTVQLTDGFMPAVGNQFQVISTTTATGAFDVTSLPSLTSGRTWNVTTNDSGVLLSVVSSSLSGDYNADGRVDAADYVMWRKTNNPALSYTTWRNNFGRSNSGSGGGLVPEPSTVLLASLLFSMTITSRRFRRSQL